MSVFLVQLIFTFQDTQNYTKVTSNEQLIKVLPSVMSLRRKNAHHLSFILGAWLTTNSVK